MGPDDGLTAGGLPGFAPDARLLILNADDFGLCHAVNEAVFRALETGLVRSTTLMPVCPGFDEAARFLRQHPETAFGIHLTVIAEWPEYRWGPVSPRGAVPSLTRPDGTFYNFQQMPELLKRVRPVELETEFRAQIERVLALGLQPTHLDWHCLRISGWNEIPQLMTRLARAYGLALRVRGRGWIDAVRGLGLPCSDHDFLDSYAIDPAHKADIYCDLLRELPVGLSEWAVHPGLDGAELLAIEKEENHIRQTDLDFFTSDLAGEVIRREGILLFDYRALQTYWKRKKENA